MLTQTPWQTPRYKVPKKNYTQLYCENITDCQKMTIVWCLVRNPLPETIIIILIRLILLLEFSLSTFSAFIHSSIHSVVRHAHNFSKLKLANNSYWKSFRDGNNARISSPKKCTHVLQNISACYSWHKDLHEFPSVFRFLSNLTL